MKISVIELYHVSIPLREIFWPTWIPGYPQTHNRFTLIRLVTDDGIEGYSAGAALGKERSGLGDLLGGYLLGCGLVLVFLKLERPVAAMFKRGSTAALLAVLGLLAGPAVLCVKGQDHYVISTVAALWGVCLGIVLERRWVRFSSGDGEMRRLVCYLVGLVG